MYRQMWKIRVFEEHANDLYLSGKMPGLTHLYSGQEAVAVGVCETLDRSDYITSTHRGHGHCVAKGARLDLMFAELLGKEDCAFLATGKSGPSGSRARPDVGAGAGLASAGTAQKMRRQRSGASTAHESSRCGDARQRRPLRT